MNSLRRLIVMSLSLLATVSAEAQDPAFSDLLAKAPPSANALVMIDVERTLAAPLAKQEGWGKKLELAYVERPIFLPPEARKLVVAASLDAAADFRRNWEMAVMELAEPLSMRSIARSEGGYVDEVRGVPAAWTPSNAYFVSFADRILGAMFPANRQFVSRWIAMTSADNAGKHSEYLRNAASMTSEQIQILLAIDLQDVILPHELDAKVREMELFQQANLTSEDVVPRLTSLEGAMLRVAVGEDVRGELRISFGKDVTPLEPVAKQLVLTVLEDLVGEIPDLKEWKIKTEGTTMRMAGMLSKDAQRRVFSVIELPSAKFSLLRDEGGSQGTAAEEGDEPDLSLMREASLTYYRSVDVLLSDLKRDLRGNKASAMIMERYAGKIDRMPILHVDEALLDYGADVAETLRMVALSKRQGGINAGVATAGMGGGGYSNYGYSYGWGATGDQYASARQSAADRTAMKAQAMAAANNARVEGSKMIADSTAAIRRAMTQKYQVEF